MSNHASLSFLIPGHWWLQRRGASAWSHFLAPGSTLRTEAAFRLRTSLEPHVAWRRARWPSARGRMGVGGRVTFGNPGRFCQQPGSWEPVVLFSRPALHRWGLSGQVSRRRCFAKSLATLGTTVDHCLGWGMGRGTLLLRQVISSSPEGTWGSRPGTHGTWKAACRPGCSHVTPGWAWTPVGTTETLGAGCQGPRAPSRCCHW